MKWEYPYKIIMKLENHERIFSKTEPYIKEYVTTQMDILDRIHYLLEKHFDGSQKKLADKLGVSEAAVSKMINGMQNFTLFELKKLEAAFNEDIIIVPCKNEYESASFKNR